MATEKCQKSKEKSKEKVKENQHFQESWKKIEKVGKSNIADISLIPKRNS